MVLDTGALVALERNDRRLWALLKAAALALEPIVVPAAALAQAWRGGQRQAPRLAAALDHSETASFDAMAREVGELCGRTRTSVAGGGATAAPPPRPPPPACRPVSFLHGLSDVVDASVALTAARVGGTLLTSDPVHLRRLVRAICDGSVRVVAC